MEFLCSGTISFKWHQLSTEILGRYLLIGLKLCTREIFEKVHLGEKVLNIGETSKDWPELRVTVVSS